jgi:hypothetical protein
MIRPMMGLCERKRERYGYMEMGYKIDSRQKTKGCRSQELSLKSGGR